MNIQYLFLIAAAIFLFLGVKGGEKRSLWLILALAFFAGGVLPFFDIGAQAMQFGVAGVFIALAAIDYIRRGFVITSQQKIWVLVAVIFLAIALIR